MELNASDARGKNSVGQALRDAVQSRKFAFGSQDGKGTNRVVIMDEVDGMSASDRGGMQELIKIIKTTQTPIICICNDRQKPTVRSLANSCYDVKFNRPQIGSIVKRMKQVAQAEGLRVDDAALEGVVASSGNDIRQVLNALQMWRTTSASMSLDAAKERVGDIKKDAMQRMTAFDACAFIYNESRKEPLFKRNDAFFVDYDLIPLMIAQNYPSAVSSSHTDERSKMLRVSLAADAVCDSDVVSSLVRTEQRWDLLSDVAVLNLRVAYIANGRIGFPGFPEWLGKNSNAGKRARLLGEMAMHARQKASADRGSMRFDYATYMRDIALVPLKRGDASAVGPVIDMLDAYGLSRDDLLETLAELQFAEDWKDARGQPHFPNLYAGITAQQKAAFTREYNKRPHPSQALVADVAVRGAKRKRSAATAAEDGDDDDDNDDDDGLEDVDNGGGAEADEDEDLSAFMKKPKAAKKDASATASKAKKPAASASASSALASGKKKP